MPSLGFPVRPDRFTEVPFRPKLACTGGNVALKRESYETCQVLSEIFLWIFKQPLSLGLAVEGPSTARFNAYAFLYFFPGFHKKLSSHVAMRQFKTYLKPISPAFTSTLVVMHYS